MTDYNDGQWYGWNGGACPVDSDTVVEVVTIDKWIHEKAGNLYWNHVYNDEDYRNIVAFRVVLPAPRAIWLIEGSDGQFAAFKSLEEAKERKAGWEEIEPEYPVIITKFKEARND